MTATSAARAGAAGVPVDARSPRHITGRGLMGHPEPVPPRKAPACRRSARKGFRFCDLSAALAMAVRSLGPPTTMSFVSRSVTSSRQSRLQKEREPDLKLNSELHYD